MFNPPNKIYEDVYSTDRANSKGKLELEKISLDGIELDKYTSHFRDVLTRSYSHRFSEYVQLSWLRRKFVYNGLRLKYPMYKNSIYINTIFVKYLRRIVGIDLQMITRDRSFSRIETYFNDFFPRFLEENPFENPDYYTFPFKNITLDFLIAVYQLEERIPMLEYADEKRMSVAVFMDFIMNYIQVKNDELDYYKYLVTENDRHSPFWVYNVDRGFKVIKGKKRK